MGLICPWPHPIKPIQLIDNFSNWILSQRISNSSFLDYWSNQKLRPAIKGMWKDGLFTRNTKIVLTFLSSLTRCVWLTWLLELPWLLSLRPGLMKGLLRTWHTSCLDYNSCLFGNQVNKVNHVKLIKSIAQGTDTLPLLPIK